MNDDRLFFEKKNWRFPHAVQFSGIFRNFDLKKIQTELKTSKEI